jgi:hypothetical protein
MFYWWSSGAAKFLGFFWSDLRFWRDENLLAPISFFVFVPILLA